MTDATGPLRIFSQENVPDLEKVAANARAYFRTTLEVMEREGTRARLRLGIAEPVDVCITWRAAKPEDQAEAREAEIRGRAGGMSDLAARCPTVIELTPTSNDEVTLTVAAILATGALGPILPADGSTLFGVRGARERIEAARRA